MHVFAGMVPSLAGVVFNAAPLTCWGVATVPAWPTSGCCCEVHVYVDMVPSLVDVVLAAMLSVCLVLV